MTFKTLYQSAKRLFNKFLGMFPSKIPTGLEEFNAWADSITSTYTMPTADKKSIEFVLSSVIINCKPTDDKMAKYILAKVIWVAAAKQVAAYKFHEIKEKQQKEYETERNAEMAKVGQSSKLKVVADATAQNGSPGESK